MGMNWLMEGNRWIKWQVWTVLIACLSLSECEFLIACDVDNPLYGENGAAHVYSRQKGADDEMVLELDKKLKYFGDFIKENLGKDVSRVPGAGAAGGLGGGFLAFLNSKLKSGIDIVLEAVKLEERIDGADFVVTGEGRIDSQSVMGKAPTGVSKICAKKQDTGNSLGWVCDRRCRGLHMITASLHFFLR